MRIRKPTERWFKVPNDEDKAELLIKALTPGERFAIFDAAFKQEVTYESATDDKPTVRQTTDKKADRIETAKAVIKDWKNIFDRDGTPLDCTPENIEKAVNGIEGFMVLVRECMDKLDADLEKEKKGQEKNLPTT